MCGICGLYAPHLPVRDTRGIVDAMNNALMHRGPDDSGSYSSGPCTIGMRRLSIIDLTSGHQPISNEDGTKTIVFNGEIYNYPELREALVRSGRHQFKTQSDTEVILHLYEDIGTEVPVHLKGMFAFCIYDEQKDTLFFARDRFGEKPFYYAAYGNTLAFSSELASLVVYEGIQRKLSTEALYYYLHFGYVPAPLTMYAEIYQLPAGHSMLWNRGDVTIRPYYTPAYKVDPALCDEDVAREQVRKTFLKAVKRQMMSDVPLGAFLSGGIDSSSVVAAMQQQSPKRVKTFTVRFEHAPYDESPIARKVAKHLDTDHHEFVVTNNGFEEDDLWRIIRHVGQPFVDSSALPMYFISKYVRDHITVCLSGDGGDEMFGGYDEFLWNLRIDQLVERTPRLLLHGAHAMVGPSTRVPGLKHVGVLRKARRALELSRYPDIDRIWKLAMMFGMADMKQFREGPLGTHWAAVRTDRLKSMAMEQIDASRLRQMMHYRLRYSLAEDMLVKVDRMSMATSLEVRAPMLDADLAQLTMQLPDHLLIRNGTTKYLLRQVARTWLPEEVFSHPKTGFSIPLHMFQNKAYEALCHTCILGPQAQLMQSLFHRPVLERIVKQGLGRKTDAADLTVYRASHQLWSMLQLAAWIHKFRITL